MVLTYAFWWWWWWRENGKRLVYILSRQKKNKDRQTDTRDNYECKQWTLCNGECILSKLANDIRFSSKIQIAERREEMSTAIAATAARLHQVWGRAIGNILYAMCITLCTPCIREGTICVHTAVNVLHTVWISMQIMRQQKMLQSRRKKHIDSISTAIEFVCCWWKTMAHAVHIMHKCCKQKAHQIFFTEQLHSHRTNTLFDISHFKNQMEIFLRYDWNAV